MKEDRKDIFQNVNEWLKFAEAKHAGLIVLNSGLVFGILSVYSNFTKHLHASLIILSLIFLGASIFFTLVSLFPRTYKNTMPSKKNKTPNLYFNGSIACLSKDEFKSELLKTHPEHTFSVLEDNLIDQTILNSKIASAKYTLFKCSIICTTTGLALPLLRIIFKSVFGF